MLERAADKNETSIERKLGFDLGNVNLWLPFVVELLIIVIVFFSLRETLHFLYADDDLMSSLLKGQFLSGITIKRFFRFEYVHTIEQIQIGRFMVGGFLAYIPMFFFTIVQYRVYTILLICINVWVLGKCVYQWTGSYKVKWFSMLLSPLFFQIHYNFHHPILSYYGGIQILFIILFSSMFFFWKYCKESKKKWLIISGTLYIWGLIYYEVSFAFLPVFILLAYLASRNVKKTVIYSLPHIMLFVLFLIANFLNRMVNAETVAKYPGSSFNFNISKILIATIKQMSATIPLSNFFDINWAIYKTLMPKLFSLKQITPGDLLTVILFLVTLFLINRTIETERKIDKKQIFVIGSMGFLIILLPAVLIGLSATYQEIVDWGRGHIPVYYQYFGLIILFSSAYIGICDHWKQFHTFKILNWITKVTFVVLYIFVLLTNQQYGRTQLNNFDRAMYDNMLALQYSLEDNIIADIPNNALFINSQVITTGLSKSDYSGQFYIAYSHKKLKKVLYIDDFTNEVIHDLKAQGKFSGNSDYKPTQMTYIVRSNRDKDEGVVYIGRVKNMTVDLDDQKIIRYEIDQLKIYAMKSNKSKYVSLYEKNEEQSYDHKYYELDPKLIAYGMNGRTYQLDFQNAVDFNSSFLVSDVDNIEPGLYDVESFPVKLSDPVIVANKLNINNIFKSGWYGIEPWGIWSEGDRQEIVFVLSEEPSSDLLVNFNTKIFAPNEELRFSALVNGSSAGNYSLPSGNQTFSIRVPRSITIKNNGLLKIVFNIENPSSPARAGLSVDERLLGIGVISFTVEADKN